MTKNLLAQISVAVIILLTTALLAYNYFVGGQSSNALILLVGFVTAQIPVLIKVLQIDSKTDSIESKVNGNYRETTGQLDELKKLYADVMKVIPPNIAKELPSLPSSITGEIPVVPKEES